MRACVLLIVCGVGFMLAAAPPPPPTLTRRPEVLAGNGMVATSHPLAAQVGLEVLKRGGNAIDAAIATNAAMCVLEPTTCGIGGDLYAIVWDAKTATAYGLNASGRAPGRATRAEFARRGLTSIPTRGALSWSVPGCVDGWATLRDRFGTLPLADLLAPAIRYAEEGAPVPPVIAGYWRASEKMLARDPGHAEAFLLKGRAPRAGEIMTNPALGASLRQISTGGRDAFYKGEIAQKIVAFSDQAGGLFTRDDFAQHTSEWVDPVRVSYRGHDVWELPPPGQGLAALQMLGILETFDLAAMGAGSADYWHRLIEAKKLAFADRAKFYADPKFAEVPVAGLIAPDYAAARAKQIDPQKAATGFPPGDPKLGAAETIYLCVVDKDRNCVSLIQSNYNGFGSGLAAPGTGFGIQNRGCLFALDETHANRLEPGKRPFHTIIPGLLTQAGRPVMPFGVMGGDMQPQGHAMVLANQLDFGLDVQAAGDFPRLEHVGSPTPRGEPGDAAGGTVLAEPGIPDTIVAELTRRGHVVKRTRVNGGGYQAIRIHPTTNVLHGGTETRKDGAAVGY